MKTSYKGDKKQTNTDTCYIAPHKHNHAKKAVNHPFKLTVYAFQTMLGRLGAK